MSKDKPNSSKTGALVMVLMVLWLAGLTALILVYLQKPAAGDLYTRVAKLETKANSLVGKIHPPGSKELNNKELNSLEDRIADLENRISGLVSDDSQPVTSQTAGCDCEKLEDRLAALETAAETKIRTAGQTRSDAPEKSTRLPKKTAAKSKFKPAAGKTLPPTRPRTNTADGDVSGSIPDYGSRDLHDMNRRYAPIYQETSDDAGGRGLLGPGSGGYR